MSIRWCTFAGSIALVLSLQAATAPDPVLPARAANDTARFLAGLPGRDGSPFVPLEGGAVWREHRRQLDAAWSRADSEIVQNLRKFQEQELSGSALRGRNLFYPFGGPDALVATLFFPRSPVYVFVGLEPAGTLPTEAQVSKKDLGRYLAEVRSSMSSELGRSFFVTQQMDRQFRGQVTDGLLVPILHLLVRTEHTVLGFRYVRLDARGAVVERPANYQSDEKFLNKGIEIEFRTDADGSPHKLYYFSVNLANEKLKDNKAFLAYLSGLTGTTTLLKATSYMTHRADFSIIRDHMLAHSAAILQDDSGIPYRWFGTADWKVQLYGAYERPYGSFRWLEQSDLRQAYQTPGAKPLALHIGYGYRRIPSNLLLAERLPHPSAAAKADPPRASSKPTN